MAPPVRPGEANIFGKRTPTAEQEALEAKREYNIKLRDERYERKQAELADQRKLKKEYEAEARQQRKQVEAMKRQTELRAGINKKQNNIEDEYRERNREAAIIRREEKWAAKTHEYIMILLDEAQEQENIEMEKKKEAKTKVLLQAKLEAKQRTETKSSQEQLEEVPSVCWGLSKLPTQQNFLLLCVGGVSCIICRPPKAAGREPWSSFPLIFVSYQVALQRQRNRK